MEPISAAIAEPMRPAMSTAMSEGASSRQRLRPTMPPRKFDNPRSTITGPISSASTPPMKNERMQTMSKLPMPTS